MNNEFNYVGIDIQYIYENTHLYFMKSRSNFYNKPYICKPGLMLWTN